MSAADRKFCAKVIGRYAETQKLDAGTAQRLVPHQSVRAAELVAGVRGGRAVLVDDAVGTGKTIVTLAAAARLLADGSVDRVLVVAPNTTVADQWAKRARFLVGDYFTAVSRKPSSSERPWKKGLVRVVSRQKLPNPPTGSARHLVIVDEAHRGLQSLGRFHDRLSAWKDAGPMMLVTATPFQLSMSGLTTMLKAGHVDDQDLEALRSYGRAATAAILSNHDGHDVSVADREKLGELQLHAGAVLDRYRRSGSLAEALNVPQPPKLSHPSCLDVVAIPEAWGNAFEIARLVPELVNCGKGDTFQRRLVSSSEAFWGGEAGKTLEDRSHRNGQLKKLVKALGAELGSGVGHPKVSATVERAAEWAGAGRHVLVFCVWKESADTIADALRRRAGRTFDVERPSGSTIPDGVRARFVKPPDKVRPLVLVLQDRFSESIDLDGGLPYLIHHDLPWNPARVRQRWGRVVRASSNFQRVPPKGIYVPILDVHTDKRLHTTVLHRAAIGDQVLLPVSPEDGGVDSDENDDGNVFEAGKFEFLAELQKPASNHVRAVNASAP